MVKPYNNATTMPTKQFEVILKLSERDALILADKHNSYGDSWKARGGVGAFMMLARKWDRIETQCRRGPDPWDIIAKGLSEFVCSDGIMDDISDLRRYLLLVEAEVVLLQTQTPHSAKDDGSEPGAGYVAQD